MAERQLYLGTEGNSLSLDIASWSPSERTAFSHSYAAPTRCLAKVVLATIVTGLAVIGGGAARGTSALLRSKQVLLTFLRNCLHERLSSMRVVQSSGQQLGQSREQLNEQPPLRSERPFPLFLASWDSQQSVADFGIVPDSPDK